MRILLSVNQPVDISVYGLFAKSKRLINAEKLLHKECNAGCSQYSGCRSPISARSHLGVPDNPRHHTGTLVGIHTNNGGCGSKKAANFDYFKYED